MRERELRIALVCFGGASLAIYMHGITKEILKLARASSALHAIADRKERSTADFFDVRDRTDPEYDTEAIYFDLLRDIGRMVDLRVIVDIVAGASAFLRTHALPSYSPGKYRYVVDMVRT